MLKFAQLYKNNGEALQNAETSIRKKTVIAQGSQI